MANRNKGADCSADFHKKMRQDKIKVLEDQIYIYCTQICEIETAIAALEKRIEEYKD